MSLFLEIIVGTLTLGLPLWFAYLDQGVFPVLKWNRVGKERRTPRWGHAVVFVGVVLAVLIALAAPISTFQPLH